MIGSVQNIERGIIGNSITKNTVMNKSFEVVKNDSSGNKNVVGTLQLKSLQIPTDGPAGLLVFRTIYIPPTQLRTFSTWTVKVEAYKGTTKDTNYEYESTLKVQANIGDEIYILLGILDPAVTSVKAMVNCGDSDKEEQKYLVFFAKGV